MVVHHALKLLQRRVASPQGIYRVNGVKTRVEKLCQAFENGKELVELSQCSPHDISNVLKLYLRQVRSLFDRACNLFLSVFLNSSGTSKCFPQLPEPIMPFRLYNSLMGLAKESLQVEAGTPQGKECESNQAGGRGPELVNQGADTDPEVLNLVDKLKELLKDLPKANVATLRYIICHLRRSALTNTSMAIKLQIDTLIFFFFFFLSGLQSWRKKTR